MSLSGGKSLAKVSTAQANWRASSTLLQSLCRTTEQISSYCIVVLSAERIAKEWW